MTTKRSTKQKILEAALACFHAHGVEATTIDMIRERAEASVGSMYHHFGNKESIAVAVYADAMREYHECQQNRLAAAHSAEDGVKAIACAYIDWISANPQKARFLLYNRGALARNAAGKDLQDKMRAQVAQARQWFEPHVESGRLKKLPLEIYSSLITGPAHDYARLWLSGRAKTDIKAYRDIFAQAAWDAVKP